VKTDSNKFEGVRTYLVVTVLALFAGLFITGIQVVFVLPVPTGFSAYFRLIASAGATLCLLLGTLLFRLRYRAILYVAGVGSVILTLTMLELLVRITPTAQGNNDSGEIFWFLVLPMVLFFSQAFLAYLKLQNRHSPR
jgi:hypothetical protein